MRRGVYCARALQNTSGKDWQCFAESHTADGHKNSYPESGAEMTANIAQFAHNESKRKKKT